MKPEMPYEEAKALFESCRALAFGHRLPPIGRLVVDRPPVSQRTVEMEMAFIFPEPKVDGQKFVTLQHGKQRVLSETESQFHIHPFWDFDFSEQPVPEHVDGNTAAGADGRPGVVGAPSASGTSTPLEGTEPTGRE